MSETSVGDSDSLRRLEWITAAAALMTLQPLFGATGAKTRICERAHAGLILARAEQFQINGKRNRDVAIPAEFWWADGHEALTQDWIAGDFSTWLQHKIELKAFGVTFERRGVERLIPPGAARADRQSTPISDEDKEIIGRLESLVPSAALSYRQALLDLRDDSRVSFRGAALELREALREVLDHLAPDNQVTSSQGFIQEKDRKGPTMKQKVRYIVRQKRSSSTTEEEAITALEEGVARLTRAVYERSSIATHVASEREAVVQLRRYVVVVLHDIL